MAKKIVILLAAVIAVAAVLVGTSAYLIASQPKVKEFKLELTEFGYNGPTGGPILKVKAGETVRVTLVNNGAVDHEFRIVKNRDAFLSDVNKAMERLRTEGVTEQDGVEKAAVFKEARRLTGLEIIKTSEGLEWDADVKPGETNTAEFVIDTPGTYWYLCGELDATFPMTHAHKNMSGQLIVE